MDEDSWSFILNWKFKLMLWLAGRAELRLDWLVKPPCVEQDMILKCYGLRAELRLSKGLLGPMCQSRLCVWLLARSDL